MSNVIDWCVGVLHGLARFLLAVLLPAYLEHRLNKSWIVVALVGMLLGITLYAYFYW